MFLKILRSVVIGLIVAGLLLLAMPSLRKAIGPLAPAQYDSADETPMSFNPAVRRAAPAVVNVYNRSVGNNGQNQLQIKTLGSGVIMDGRGYIITNKHVINDAEQIIVALQDGRVFEALLIGSDSLTDLAVLKINATNLPIIPINGKRQPHIGDVVMAIGNPYNLGQTVTQGIISATGRIGLSPSGRQSFLQTDASINRGNSGGALVNSLGELMGINTLSFDKSNDGETPEGIGFAIPTQLATKIMDKLIRDGRVIRGYIGIGGREITPLHGPSTGIDQLQGIIVNAVSPDGPAALAGIQVNDVIISVNHKPAVSALETMDQVAEIRPGSVIPVEVMREDKKLTLQVTVQEYPAGG
ncbi:MULTISPECIES: outer membrane-stress sensor serine endopeptidase DegS [Cedecea]|jgi:serine protease DegS|uniref:Serine endoprotease DegS n=1 Tax=Cedecea neteri TaxID=158822 RepID=A0A089Q5V4_9ENTR|nr:MULTISPECIES: outer membrane-stress sensor serine endopeptidase DegS [Cedecea]AIR05804.1 serine endoprotease [Cedecea neteri]NWC62494.1 outer membrane-stress sensor serine endopeptidase DegS [Cedecea sp. P7760]